MTLDQLQTNLLSLIKHQQTSINNEYLQEVSTSIHLKRVQEIILWWRCQQISSICPFTTKILNSYQLFEEVVEKYIFAVNFSPYVENIGDSFIDFICKNEQLVVPTIVKSIALTETALKKVVYDVDANYEVNWDYDPNPILYALFTKQPIKDNDFVLGKYNCLISNKYPILYKVVSVASVTSTKDFEATF